jgi:aspartate dehydrogenase
MTAKLKIGLVGCGTIGTRMAQAIDQGMVIAELSALNDLEKEKADELMEGLKTQIPIFLGLEEIFKNVNLVVEAASPDVVPQIIPLASRYRIDCMIMSIGGLLGAEYMINEAKEAGIRIYCPSGAIAGLDAIAAASVGRVDSVLLTTRKPPQALKAAPYITEKGIDLDTIKEERIIFEGPAIEAVPLFPKNINVAAALSLAGVGPKRTIVRIIVDPKIKRNSHQIEVEGEFGKLITRTENLPAPFNPRTSYLAALSAIACLQKITNPLKLGG